MAELTPDDPKYYIRDPKTGLSQAQVDANKLVAEAAKTAGKQVVTGDTGESNRVFVPYEAGSKEYLGKEYATAAGAYTAAVKTAEKVGPPGEPPAGLHWNLQGTEWKLYDAEGKPFNYIGNGAEDFSGDGSANNPLLYKGKPFSGIKGGTTYVNGVPKGTSNSGDSTGASGGKTIVSTYTNETTGDVIAVYSDGSTSILSKGAKQADAELKAKQAAEAEAEAKRKAGQSAYDLLFSEFDRYGLGALIEPLKGFIVEGLSPAELTLRLRDTDAYKKRFAANEQRIKSGFRALSEAEYIRLEDQYQEVMRRYGMPESYYKRGDMGRQEGFEKFIAGDVSATELEDRIQTAYNRVINANPEVSNALRAYYPEITDGDILAYALDPSKAIDTIKRKVTAAEIGGAATMAGLGAGVSRAEELAKYGITGEQARAGYQAIGSLLPRATQLGDIYAKQGMGPFTQTTAEQEIFGITGATEAAAKRKKLSELEQAQFGGSAGVAGGALGRERAGQF